MEKNNVTDITESAVTLDGQHLYSELFDDHYASRFNPADEKFFVFCTGNALEQRFRKSSRFTIGELGFGAGISFLVTLGLWRKCSRPEARLNYISTEMFPLSRQALTAALEAYPSLSSISEKLLSQWPDLVPGFHRLEFDDENVSLTLIFGDALNAMDQLDSRVDAWFLDGFSPRKNPQMWTPELFKRMRLLSHKDTTLATYTAAAQVRRDLQQAGFTVSKTPGYGQKRERIVGKITSETPAQHLRAQRPWLRHVSGKSAPVRRVAVIGAGIAGCACANRFSARGLEVTLFDQGPGLASGTSKNPAAIIHPTISTDANISTRLSVQGYLYTLNKLDQLRKKNLSSGFHATALISKPKNKTDRQRRRAILDDSRYPDSFLSADPEDRSNDAMLFPRSGWIEMGELCQALIEEYHQKITLALATPVSKIVQQSAGWQVQTENGAAKSFDAVVVATGYKLTEFSQTDFLDTEANKGQISHYAVNQASEIPVSQGGYAIPTLDHGTFVGSSYRPGCDHTENTFEENQQNLEKLISILPGLELPEHPELIGAWSGIRATTADRLPLAGAVVDAEKFRADFSSIILGENRKEYPPPPYLDGLYVCSGLGSRAMTYGLLCAELVASLCCNEQIPVPQNVYQAVHPARQLVRKIQRSRD